MHLSLYLSFSLPVGSHTYKRAGDPPELTRGRQHADGAARAPRGPPPPARPPRCETLYVLVYLCTYIHAYVLPLLFLFFCFHLSHSLPGSILVSASYGLVSVLLF